MQFHALFCETVLVWSTFLSSKLRNCLIVRERINVSFPKFFSGKAAVNTTMIRVFRRSIPDFGLLLRDTEMLQKLLHTSNCYGTDLTFEIIRLQTRRLLNVVAREDRRYTTCLGQLSWREEAEIADRITRVVW